MSVPLAPGLSNSQNTSVTSINYLLEPDLNPEDPGTMRGVVDEDYYLRVDNIRLPFSTLFLLISSIVSESFYKYFL